MTFSIDNPEGGLQQPPPPLGKYVWEKPSGEQGLILLLVRGIEWQCISRRDFDQRELAIRKKKVF